MSVDADWLAPDWRIAGVGALMTTRAGGVSSGRYASMNVGSAVADDAGNVGANRVLLAEAMGATPVRTAVVEDTPVGVTAAVAAGMRAIGYAADSDPDALRAAGAELIASLDELPVRLGLVAGSGLGEPGRLSEPGRLGEPSP